MDYKVNNILFKGIDSILLVSIKAEFPIATTYGIPYRGLEG